MLSAFDVKGGLVVSAVEMGSLAERAGLNVGDIIVSLNQVPTPNIGALNQAVTGLPKAGVVTIGIIRDGVPMILGLRVE
jgi:serine protease Do